MAASIESLDPEWKVIIQVIERGNQKRGGLRPGYWLLEAESIGIYGLNYANLVN